MFPCFTAAKIALCCRKESSARPGMRKLCAQRLTKEQFAPYGQVICRDGECSIINQGTGQKWNNLVDFDMSHDNGTVNLGILRTTFVPLTFSEMERHLFTSQIFIPMEGKRSLVAVCPPDDNGPDPDKIKLFLLQGNEGVSFNRKVWHHTLFPLDGETDYTLMMRGGFEVKDVEVVPFRDDIHFQILLMPEMKKAE